MKRLSYLTIVLFMLACSTRTPNTEQVKESATDTTAVAVAPKQTITPQPLDYCRMEAVQSWSDTSDRYIIQYWRLNNFDPKEIVKYQFVPEEDDEWAQINIKTSKDTTYFYGIKYRVAITDLKSADREPDTIEITRNMFLHAANIADIDRRYIDDIFPLDVTGDTLLLGVRLRFLPIYGDIDGGVYYFGKGKPLKLEVKFDKYN